MKRMVCFTIVVIMGLIAPSAVALDNGPIAFVLMTEKSPYPDEPGVYVAKPLIVNYQLELINPDGSGRKSLFDLSPGNASVCQFAPDGQKILIQGHKSTEKSAFFSIVDLKGNLLQSIDCNYPGGGYQEPDRPNWTPDSKAILFDVLFDGIFYQKVGQNKPIRVNVTPEKTLDHLPILSPDGKKLAFVHHEYGIACFIRLIQLNNDITSGKSKEPITVFEGESGHNENISLFFTPDSQFLVFQNTVIPRQKDQSEGDYIAHKYAQLGYAPYPHPSRICIYDLEKHTTRELVAPESTNSWALSPDGKTIAFGTSNGIYIVDFEGKALLQLTKNSVVKLVWSPDSNCLAYTTKSGYYLPAEIHVLNLNDKGDKTVTLETNPKIIYTMLTISWGAK